MVPEPDEDIPPDEVIGSGNPVDLRTLSLTIIAGISIILLLRFAQSVFIPLAVGVVISYALDPIVSWLGKLSIPRPLGAAVVLAAVVGGLGFGIFTLVDDAVAVVEKLPAAARQVRTLVRRGDAGEGLMEKVQEAATVIENTATQTAAPKPADGVMRVQLEEKPINVRDYLWRGGTEVTAAASEVVLVIFLVYFMLIAADLFKKKIMKIIGTSRLRRRVTAQILDDISAQISRFMLVQMITSLFVGVVSGLAFWMIGLQQATIWGIVVALLNMIPYFGPVVATAGLFTMGLLQFGTAMMGLYLAGVALLVTSVEGFVLLPWLTYRTMRINGVALFLGLMFWGWMWGFWGLLLAVPMLVMIKAVSDRIEGLKPIGELLGT